MRNRFVHNMKRKFDEQTIFKMNKLYWDDGLSMHKVCFEMKISYPVVLSFVTITRAEYHKMKEQFKNDLLETPSPSCKAASDEK